MYNPAIIITSLLAATSLATPLSHIETRAAPTNFKLKTTVINGKHVDKGTNKNDLWVYSYHTGAGLGDAALDKNQTYGNIGYINASDHALIFELDQLSWPMELDFEPYAAWGPVEISVASIQPATGFFINSTGLHSNYSSNAGWLACDWWHGVSFYLFLLMEPLIDPFFRFLNFFWTSGYYDDPIPSSCSTVQLDVVDV